MPSLLSLVFSGWIASAVETICSFGPQHTARFLPDSLCHISFLWREGYVDEHSEREQKQWRCFFDSPSSSSTFYLPLPLNLSASCQASLVQDCVSSLLSANLGCVGSLGLGGRTESKRGVIQGGGTWPTAKLGHQFYIMPPF